MSNLATHPVTLSKSRPPRHVTSLTAIQSSAWRRWLIITLVLGYVGFLVIVPLLGLVFGAFSAGLGAVIDALSQADALLSFWRTLWISLLVVVIHAIFGTIVAWVLVRQHFPGRQLINALIDMPFAVSPVVVGYMLLLLFGRNGLLFPLLTMLDIQVAFAIPGVILATLFVTMPFMVRELIPVLAAFGVQQEQAAATLGANGWQTFWLVTFPALRWGFIYGVVLTFARALGEFGAVLVIGGGLQGSTQTSTIYIFHALEERQYIGAYSAALALGLFSLILVIGFDQLRPKEK